MFVIVLKYIHIHEIAKKEEEKTEWKREVDGPRKGKKEVSYKKVS